MKLKWKEIKFSFDSGLINYVLECHSGASYDSKWFVETFHTHTHIAAPIPMKIKKEGKGAHTDLQD